MSSKPPKVPRPLQSYFDDYFGGTLAPYLIDTVEFIIFLFTFLGFPVHRHKVFYGQIVILLGIEVSLFESLHFSVSALRKSNLIFEMSFILELDCLPPQAQIKKLIGKLLFAVCHLANGFFQFMSPLLYPLFWYSNEHPLSTQHITFKSIRSQQDKFYPALRRSIRTLIKLIPELPSQVADIRSFSDLPLLITTDADFCPTLGGGHVGAIFHTDENLQDCETLSKFICCKSLPEGTSQIAFLELVAVLFSLQFWKEKLRNRNILVHTDNIVVFYAISRGRSRNSTICKVAHEILLLSHKMLSPILAQWLPSKANPADLLTRRSIDFKSMTEISTRLKEEHNLNVKEFHWDDDVNVKVDPEWFSSEDPADNAFDPNNEFFIRDLYEDGTHISENLKFRRRNYKNKGD